MPAATTDFKSALDAFKYLGDNVEGLAEVGAHNSEIDFLQDVLTDFNLLSLVKAHESIEHKQRPGELSAVLVSQDVLDSVADDAHSNGHVAELQDIFDNPHVQALLVSHDDIKDKKYLEEDEVFEHQIEEPPAQDFNIVKEQNRFVRIRKSHTEPLGITVKLDESGDLVVARILAGSLIDRQGLLRINDIIREVNGISVMTPEELMIRIDQSDPEITLKIVPSPTDFRSTGAFCECAYPHDMSQPCTPTTMQKERVYMKVHFNYDPMKDRLNPCKDAGLPFQDGDVLEIISMKDPNYWQARHADTNGPTGLVPSKALEEKRRSFVSPDCDYSKGSLFCGLTRRKKKKVKYSSNDSKEFDNCDIIVYEEVKRMIPFPRKILVLVGSQGVGRRALKEKLIREEPTKYAAAMPHTSRPPREGEKNGQGYYFVDRETMERDQELNKFIEFGEFNGNLYGTKIDTVYEVVKTGKMCVLDVNPTSLKLLKTTEFMPYIVFIAAPSVEALKVMYEDGKKARMNRGNRERLGVNVVEEKTEDDFIQTVEESAEIEKVYKGYFDETIVNDSFVDTYHLLRKAVRELTSQEKWVPVSMVY